MQRSFQKNIKSLFSNRKKLIVSGCSYTANYAKQEKLEEFPIWAQLVADALDMELVNLASGGYGNKAIYHTIIGAMIETKNVGLVIPMWSEWQRVCPFVDVPETEPVNREPWRSFLPERIVRDAEWHDKFYKPPMINPKKKGLKYELAKVLWEKSLTSIRGGAVQSLGYMFAFQSICENMNIPHLQMQGCQPLMGKIMPQDEMNYNELARHIVDSPYVDKFKNSFIGWPVVRSLGGYSADWLLGDSDRISPEDSHPNKKGHEIIGEGICNEYNTIYS